MSSRSRLSTPSKASPATLLRDGIEQLQLQIPRTAQAKLLSYISLLVKWNQIFNLTAINDPQQMVVRHLLDSLSLAPYIKGPRLVDVGSGAGLPGMPLALGFPDYEVVLLDSQLKKVRFLNQVIADLEITNIHIAHTRVQDYHPQQMFDTVVSRAFASLGEFSAAAKHLCARHGCMLSMKGRFPVKELQAMQQSGSSIEIIPVKVPGLDAERHIARISC
jgi:16S rRNA (guanine527-N7)-methyltransferase